MDSVIGMRLGWTASLSRARALFDAGAADHAVLLLQQVYEEASHEREQHALGTGARWECTKTIGTALELLRQVFRHAPLPHALGVRERVPPAIALVRH